jgi:hypothetical protein
LSYACSPFCVGYFWDKVSPHTGTGLTLILLFVLPGIAGMTAMRHLAQSLTEIGVLQTFYCIYPGTHNYVPTDVYLPNS